MVMQIVFNRVFQIPVQQKPYSIFLTGIQIRNYTISCSFNNQNQILVIISVVNQTFIAG